MQTRWRALIVCFGLVPLGPVQQLELSWRQPCPLRADCTRSRSSSFLVPYADQLAGARGLSRAALSPLTSSMLAVSAALEGCRIGSGSGGCAASHEAGSAEWDVLAWAIARAWAGGYGGRSRAHGRRRGGFPTTRQTGMAATVREA
jgi:hypothetical protein